jgi:protein SCO1/2
MSGRRSISVIISASAVVLGLLGWALSAIGRPAAGASGGSALVSQEGKAFSLQETRGKTTVLSFMFSHCPSICPLQTRALKDVQSALPETLRPRVRFVSVSVDPERDTPEVLKAFAARMEIDLSTWSFVTGPGALPLGERYNAEVSRDESGQIDHRAAVFLLDATGRLAQTYTGAPIDKRRLVREIEQVDRIYGERGRAEARLEGRAP